MLSINDIIKTRPYLKDYLTKLESKGYPLPTFYKQLESNLRFLKRPNILYQINEYIFIHINGLEESEGYILYNIIEPPLPDPRLMKAIDKAFVSYAGSLKVQNDQDRLKIVEDFLLKTCVRSNTQVDYSKALVKDKVYVYALDYEYLRYYFLRKRVGLGILEPFLLDPYLEDISIQGEKHVYVVHKIFGTLKASTWLTNEEVEELIISMSEQFGKTISHSRPIIDATLPEGSRINIVFGKDISRKGTNATIRRFASVPMSITQLVALNTLDSREVAYMWMMINEGMSVFICGETASGKTTTMMALCAFIPSTWKVITIEDTPEITLPHSNWFNEVTRDTGNPESSVTMFDLLKAALRQRPNYIIVGEIRGAEGNIAFQAMQTGHPVISTFHAATVSSLLQRLTSEPINVPKTHLENLNIALFQNAVQGKQGKVVRRVLSINEIIGYDPTTDSIMFIPIFNWEPSEDKVLYRGKGSSALFANKLLIKRGLSRNEEVLLYDELEARKSIIDYWVDNKLFNYYDVYKQVTKVNTLGINSYIERLGIRL